jgi:hypothetical protein
VGGRDAAVRSTGPSGSRLNARDGLSTIRGWTGGGKVVDGGGGGGGLGETRAKTHVAAVQLGHVTPFHFSRSSEYRCSSDNKFTEIFI